jgi:hypothetical protein
MMDASTAMIQTAFLHFNIAVPLLCIGPSAAKMMRNLSYASVTMLKHVQDAFKRHESKAHGAKR